MITISRKSPLSGKVNEMTINVSEWEYDAGMEAWSNGAYIQDVFPTLNADEREFIKTGITPLEWELIFEYETDNA